MKPWAWWFSIVWMLAASLGACAAELSVQGSDTMVLLAQRWANAYMGSHPGLRIEVSGGGSGTGVAALVNRTADLATCSRKIRAREVESYVRAFGVRPREYPVALDAVLVHVHPSNPVSALDFDQLSGLFSGRIRNWREVGGKDQPVVLYGRESSSGTYEFFRETVLRGGDYSPSLQPLQGSAQVAASVAADPGGLGFSGGLPGAGTRRLRLAQRPGQTPEEASETTVRSGRYPLWRRLYVYVHVPVDRGAVQDWVAWMRGKEGQSMLGELGFYRLEP
jgi:phosphate transport system substrate-binding protein